MPLFRTLPLLAVAFQPRDDVRAVGIERKHLSRDARGVEDLLEIVDDQVFVARRVGRVEPQHRLIVPQDLRLDRRPIEFGILRDDRYGRDHGRDSEPRAPSPQSLHRDLARSTTTS